MNKLQGILAVQKVTSEEEPAEGCNNTWLLLISLQYEAAELGMGCASGVAHLELLHTQCQSCSPQSLRCKSTVTSASCHLGRCQQKWDWRRLLVLLGAVPCLSSIYLANGTWCALGIGWPARQGMLSSPSALPW